MQQVNILGLSIEKGTTKLMERVRNKQVTGAGRPVLGKVLVKSENELTVRRKQR